MSQLAPVLLGLSVVLLLAIIFFIIRLQKELRSLETKRGLESLKENQERSERAMSDEMKKNREESDRRAKDLRDEVREALKGSSDSVLTRLSEFSKGQKSEFDRFGDRIHTLTESNEKKLERMRQTVEKGLEHMQEDNNRRLDQMRQTVDEKLQSTLETRLTQSFKQVGDQLKRVHEGLGEMQNLASGVGDLKKVLTNVKTRGTWGEIQLGNLLEQILSPMQYEKNVRTRPNARERVEYAIKLPGRSEEAHDCVWLPIDSKFPKEDYDRLIEAQERADAVGAEESAKRIEARIKKNARDIREKYIEPPATTDFAIMFLPTEGLYAEVLRRPGLSEYLQREQRVVVAGPATLGALLNALQMGFQTLAIQKHSSEAWRTLTKVKGEFEKFGDLLEKVEKKLQEASNTIGDAKSKSRNIERKLGNVERISRPEARVSLTLFDSDGEEEN